MIILGLTGSIGMGKSTTANMFAQQGIPVYDSDAAVHDLYAAGPAVTAIESLFPGTTNEDGVDRKKLGARVLGDNAALKKLEDLIHPMVRRAEKEFLSKARDSGASLVVLDIPLLFETSADKRVDKILVVTAPPDVQRDRVMSREGMTEARFNAIMSKQMSDEEKRSYADYVIDTSKGMDAARKATTEIIEELSA